jgi:hypothetical protein
MTLLRAPAPPCAAFLRPAAARGPRRAPPRPRASAAPPPLPPPPAQKEDQAETAKKASEIEATLLKSGMDRAAARSVLKSWQEAVGHELTPDDLRKLVLGSSGRAVAAAAVSTLLDAGAAVGAAYTGAALGAGVPGLPGAIGQSLAFLVCGWCAGVGVEGSRGLGPADRPTQYRHAQTKPTKPTRPPAAPPTRV